MEDAGDVPRAVDERQRGERDEVRAGAFGEGVDGESSHSEAVHFRDAVLASASTTGLRRTKAGEEPGFAPVA